MSMKTADILIIDGDDIVTEVLTTYSRLFTDSGIHVVGSARDGFTAYEMIVSKRPDIVVIDIDKNGMDSIVTLKKLEMCGLNKKMAVIALTQNETGRFFKTLAEYVSAYTLLKSPGIKTLVNEIQRLKNVSNA